MAVLGNGDEELEGEVITLDDEETEVEDTPDGGAIVRLPAKPRPGDSKFYENLADTLPSSVLNALGARYIEYFGRDKEARQKRVDQYEEGVRRTGLGNDAPGGAQFQGASKVVHPMLTEVCVDFASRAIKELFPADGPAKTKIVGELTKERVAKASRKADFMNWQLTVQAMEFRAELEQLLTQLPLSGGCYMKVTWNKKRNRPEFLFIPIDDMLLPFAATNFYTAQRKTHVQYLTQLDYEARVKSGMYVDLELPSAGGMTPEASKASVANDKIEGREDTSFNQDGLRTVFESDTLIDLGEDDPLADGTAPYILSIDKTSGKVLGLYRNWDEDDETHEPMQWAVEFPFVPWRGAYPIGMTHMIGGLSAAATGSLRALLDSALINNSQSMIKLKGGSAGGQSIDIQPTQISEIEGGLNVDDIRKLAMPLPYNPPSAVLYQLMGFLVTEAKGVVRTTVDESPENASNMPVGTQLARIEQGMTVFSAIHARLHNAMQRLLMLLNRLNGMYLDDSAEVAETGSLIAKRTDFDGPLDVVPVSDPNIFSEAQRFAQVQAVAQRAGLHPDIYDTRKVEERILATLKIPDPGGLLRPGQTPVEENAVSENVKASLGSPILAFPDQDHIAHLQAHIAYMQSPALGKNPLIAPGLLPVMLGHIKEHIALWYAAEVFKTASEAADDVDLEAAMKKTKDKGDKQALDRLIAQASLNVTSAADQVFGELDPVIAQAMQMAQQLAPQMPQDPTAMVALKDIEMRGKLGTDKNALEREKLDLQKQDKVVQLRADQQRTMTADQLAQRKQTLAEEQVRIDAQLEEMRLQADIAMNHEDNVTTLAKEGVMAEHSVLDSELQRGHDGLQAERDREHAAEQAQMGWDHTAEQAELGREAASAAPAAGE